MMASVNLSGLTNPLLTSSQLISFRNSSPDTSRHFTQSILTNAAAILLRLPQDVTATALVLLQRYQVTSAQVGMPHSDFQATTVSAAVVFLTAKLSSTPLSPRSIVNVYAYLTSSASPLWFINPTGPTTDASSKSYYVSEGTYEREREQVFAAETHVLAVLGFDTRVVLPHALSITYMQALGARSDKLNARVMEHLNGGLLSPQLVYLTHQANALAVAAIYLAAREVGVKLVEENWWEVFDVDREDLGFLVLAFGSLGNFAEAEREKFGQTGYHVESSDS